MKVALKHHYGWKEYDVEAASLDEAAYKAVRQSHDFLTDDNHSHDEGPIQGEWGGKTLRWLSVRIRYVAGHVRLPFTPAWHGTNTGDLWFAVEYRAV